MRGALLESGFHRTSRMIFVRVDVGLDEQFDDCSIEPWSDNNFNLFLHLDVSTRRPEYKIDCYWYFIPNGIISRYDAQLHNSRAYQFTPKVLFWNRFEIFYDLIHLTDESFSFNQLYQTRDSERVACTVNKTANWILFLCRYLNLISVDNLENFSDDEDSKVLKAVESSESIRHFHRSRQANDSLRKLFRDSKRLRYVQNLKRDREPIPVNIIANPVHENTF